MVSTAAIAVGGYIFLGGVSSVHGVTLRPLLAARTWVPRADRPRQGCGAEDAAGPAASLAATPDGCAPPARLHRPQELRVSGASFPRWPLPRRVAEGSAPCKGTAEEGKIQPPVMGPAHLHGVILYFCNRSASASRSLAGSLARSLSLLLAACSRKPARGGGGGCTAQGREIAHVGQSCFKEYIAGKLRGTHATTTFGRVSLATFFINDCGKAPPGRRWGRGRAGARRGCNLPGELRPSGGAAARPVRTGSVAGDRGSEDSEQLSAFLSPRVSFC